MFQNWSNTDTKWVKDLILHKTYLKLKFTFEFYDQLDSRQWEIRLKWSESGACSKSSQTGFQANDER